MCKACEVVRSVIKPCDVVQVHNGSVSDRAGDKGVVFGTATDRKAEVVFPDGSRRLIALADLMRIAPAIGG